MDVTMELKDKSYLDNLLVEINVKNLAISKESKFGIVVGYKQDCGKLNFNVQSKPFFS